jgi:hypothetical protein
MKRAWFIVLGGLLVGMAAYACIYLVGTSAQRSMAKSDQPALAWMQQEYQLSDAQLGRIRELQAAYQPKCAEMCRKIDEKNAQLCLLLARTNAVTPEIKQTLAQSAQLRADCETAMLGHFYEIAREMPPTQAGRYLAWVQQETLMPGHMPPTQPASSSPPGMP